MYHLSAILLATHWSSFKQLLRSIPMFAGHVFLLSKLRSRKQRVTFPKQVSKIRFLNSFCYRGGLTHSESEIPDIPLNYVLDSNTVLILEKHVTSIHGFFFLISHLLFFFRPSGNQALCLFPVLMLCQHVSTLLFKFCLPLWTISSMISRRKE